MKRIKSQILNLIYTALIMAILLILLKFIPMQMFGKQILFDASMHIVVASFILYFIYLFIDENKDLRIPYFIFCLAVILIISIQRIISNNHNDIGLLMGLIIALLGIGIPRFNQIKNKIKF